jgi:hypothetical protein
MFQKPVSILFFLLLSFAAVQGHSVNGFVPCTGWGICKKDSKEVIVLRKFMKEGHCWYFVVYPQSLATGIVPADSISVNQASWEMIRSRYSGMPYIRALKQAGLSGGNLQNAGFTRLNSLHGGIIITIDLCPSPRALDRIVFTELLREAGKTMNPVPIAVAVTGQWLRMHHSDFKWLDSLEKAGDLSVVWINHSFHHFTYDNVPLNINFMAAPGTDVDSEVLSNESEMIRNNIMPSVFFRFPGLVSDTVIYNKVLQLGLIPIGSDAWLAKGQKPSDGSIVLIHANGNDPAGVRAFISLLKIRSADLLSKRWRLFDLRQSLADDVSR